MLPPTVARRLAALLSLVALAGFVAVHVYAVYAAYALPNATGKLGPNTLWYYIANGLTGLVSGVVAAGFGVAVDSRTPKPDLRRMRGVARVIGLDAALHDPIEPWRVRLAVAYVLAYVIVAFAAIVTVLATDPNFAELTRTLAVVATGTLIAVASSFLIPR